MEEIMKKYINKKVVWNESYKDNISNDIEILDSICFHGGFDKQNNEINVVLTERGKTWS